MSILIKGMEMPTDRPQLLWVYPNGKALTVQSDVDPWKDLQATPVPPHGRLIDADALMKEIQETCKRLYGTDDISTASPTLSAFKLYIGEAPTVIEAEEEA